MAIVNTRYYSMSLHGNISFNAIIPFEDYGNFPDFNQEPFKRETPLKTLYLLHGITDDENSWLLNTNIARYAEENHIAVVMPYGYDHFYLDISAWERWGEFIGKELVDYTRGLFGLSAKREDTYIGGLSMGGYGALRNGLKYNDTFSKIVALSSGLRFYDLDQVTEDHPVPMRTRSFYERVFGPLDQILGSDRDPEQLYREIKMPVSIFMAIGEDDFLKDANRQFKSFLEEQKADLTYYEAPGNHEWDFWNRNIEKGIQWLLKENDGTDGR